MTANTTADVMDPGRMQKNPNNKSIGKPLPSFPFPQQPKKQQQKPSPGGTNTSGGPRVTSNLYNVNLGINYTSEYGNF